MQLRTILIDDEKKALEVLKSKLLKFPDEIEIVGMANSVASGLEVIDSTEFDLLFLDIEMRDGSGFTLLKQCPEIDFEIVFTTAFNQYALQAFKVNAIDYLLKPINSEDLQESIKRVQKRTQGEIGQSRERLKDVLDKQKINKLALKERGKITFVDISDVIYMKADGVYCEIYCTNDRSFVTSYNLGHYENLVKDDGFLRIHRSYLINVNELKEYLTHDHQAILNNGVAVPVAKPMRKEVNRLMSA